jgi:hypothetical protein
MAILPKQYVSGDVETLGPRIGVHSMISFGACFAFNQDIQIYQEIKPINNNYALDENGKPTAMRIGCLGIESLMPYRGKSGFDPTDEESFSPELVLPILHKEGRTPKEAMNNYCDWAEKHGGGLYLMYAAAPIVFDGGFQNFYFSQYCERENPFSFSGEDINSMYRGAVGDIYANIRDLNLRPPGGLDHNSLNDSIAQCNELEHVLKLMEEK